jgi:hypothetical protein
MADPAPAPPKLALLVNCVECGDGVDTPFPVEQGALALLLAQRGWYLSALSPPQGPEVPILLGAVCNQCAPKAFPPELLKQAEERRQALLAKAAGK